MHNRTTIRTKRNAGFTLIELLFVISVIAVLSSMVVGVIGSASNDAKVAATKSRMQVIEKLLSAELEGFEVRRSPLPFPVISQITSLITSKLPNPKWAAGTTSEPTKYGFTHARNLKRILTLDLMRCEFPDLIAGLPDGMGTFPSKQLQDFFEGEDEDELKLTSGQVASILVTARKYQTANTTRWANWGGTVNTLSNLTEDEQKLPDSAEVLYTILSQLDLGGTNGMDAIGGGNATADTDGDGFLEVVDSWGDPIGFQFHQNLIIPVEQDGAGISLGAAANNETGVWVDWDGPERFTDFSVTLPVLPSEVRFFLTSTKLREISGEPADFITPDDLQSQY